MAESRASVGNDSAPRLPRLGHQLTNYSTQSSPRSSPLPLIKEEKSDKKFADAEGELKSDRKGEGSIVEGNKQIRRYWNAPILRQLWGMEQHVDKVGWFELFYDLIYVALAINLSAFLKKNTDAEGVATAALFFTQLFSAWNSLTIFESRFHTRDVFGTTLKFLYSASALFMNVFVLDGLKSRFQFSIASAASRICLVIMYGQVLLVVPRARAFARVAVTGNLVSVCLFVAAAFMQRKEATAVTWIIASIVVENVWLAYVYSHTQTSIPINIEHIAERYGLFIMLMHGETIIAIGTETSVDSPEDFAIVFWGFLIVFCLHNIYFGSLPKEPEDHALRLSGRRGRAFIYLHIILGFALIAVGTALAELKKATNTGKSLKRRSFSLLALSIVLFLISVNAIRLTHNFKVGTFSVWFIRCIFIALMMILPFTAGNLEPQEIASIYAIFMIVLVNIETVDTAEAYEEGEARLNNLPPPPKNMTIDQMKHLTPDKQTYRMQSINISGGSTYFAPPLKRQGASASIRKRDVVAL